ncbi:MAG: hypothetical protein AB9869_04885 [Verrucomicrobiia bacterium]
METFGPLAFAALDMEIKVLEAPKPVQSDVSRYPSHRFNAVQASA